MDPALSSHLSFACATLTRSPLTRSPAHRACTPTNPNPTPTVTLTLTLAPTLTQPFKFTLGQCAVIPGWEHSVDSMQVGEMLDLKC